MRTGWYYMDGTKITQSMQNEDGKQKGPITILQERGLYRNGMKHEELKELLSAQPDFKEQESLLTEIAHKKNHLVIYFPKYHCEFNWIERYSGAVKRYCREHCTYSMETLPDTMEAGFNSITAVNMRRFARKAYRYMDAYRGRNGEKLTPYQVEWAVKKFKHHRIISDAIFNEAISETRTQSGA